MGQNHNLTYASAGVDIDAGNQLVEAIKPLAKATHRTGTMGSLGGFGALFDLKASGFTDPLLVACTDGVGTKVKLAIDAQNFTTVGQDLVAMCVNDLVVQGAEPLFFLDYYATNQLNVAAARDVIAGIAAACSEAGCALIGGETAEMPGLYAAGDFDLAGFAVGAVERGQQIDGRTVTAGDTVIGLASSGIHSNGFSLVRKIIDRADILLKAPCPFATGQSWGDALLTPTRLYVKPILAARRAGIQLKALAHITGGGLLENIPRILPEKLGVVLDGAWPIPPVFHWLAEKGPVAAHEMARTFNCGIGMAIVVDAADTNQTLDFFRSQNIECWSIGTVTPGNGVTITNWDNVFNRA